MRRSKSGCAPWVLTAVAGGFLCVAGSAGAQPYQVIKDFNTQPFPVVALIEGLDGAFYGVTQGGGSHGYGTVFKVSADGSSFSVLHSFDYEGGAYPSSLFLASDGAFCGTTYQGGASGYGTVFRISADGSSFSLVHSFDRFQGASPTSVIEGSGGALYGTTFEGGSYGYGTAFRMAADGSSFSLLHTFAVGDGVYPIGIVLGADAAFYGTAIGGGVSRYGTVFRISPDGSSFTVLQNFDASRGGTQAPVLLGADGALYGTTMTGGTFGQGTVFRVSADGTTYSVVHDFNGAQGSSPRSRLYQASSSTFYGTTSQGGTLGQGTVFTLSADGSSFGILHDFDLAGGAYPYAGLALGTDGALYGTTTAGGGGTNSGTAFRLSVDGSSFSVVHGFDNADGGYPDGALFQAADGFFYGTTYSGGEVGTVFKVFADGSAFSTLHAFDFADGANPSAGLVQGADGAFYGTTLRGGASQNGAAFRVSADGASSSLLHSFSYFDGQLPDAGLVLGLDGALYGTTDWGGSFGWGAVFKVSADGSSYSVLHSFNEVDGAYPDGGVIQGSDGALYGITRYGGAQGWGTVFRVSADGSSFSVLHNFVYAYSGGWPHGRLVEGSDGAFYGTTFVGGTAGWGTAYRLLPGSSLSVIHNFDTTASIPDTGLAPAAEGFFYGTTQVGGALGWGTVFRLSADGSSFSILHSFDYLQGATAGTTVITGSDGALYGTTRAGGRFSGGVLYRLEDDSGFQFAKPVFTASEASPSMLVTVTRKGPISKSATVDYATSDGTATAGLDYVATTGQLAFAPFVATKAFAVKLLPDTLYEGPESLLVSLSNPQGPGARLRSQRTAVVTITDNDSAPTIQFGTVAYAAIEGGPAAKITVVRSLMTTVPVTVSYAAVDGTAIAPGDYASTSGTLSFGPGVVSQTFSVAISDDAVPEPTESLGLLLSAPGGGAILGTRSKATLTIKDNDQSVQFSAASYSVSEVAGKAIVTVKRTGGGSGTLTVDWAAGDGTATAPGDYSAASGQLVFGPGVGAKTFAVPIVNDTLPEGSETVQLSLSNANPPSALGAPSNATLTILDNEPVVQFSATQYVASEPVGSGTGKAIVTVRRLGSLAGTVHVSYATSAGTAVPGIDYADATGQLTFGQGVATRTFAVPLLGNTVDEPNPTVNLALSPVDIPLGTPSSAILTLRDNDVAGKAQLGATVFSGLASTGWVGITVTRSGGTAGPASVQYATSDGTAVANTDYTATTGTLTFGPGETSKWFLIPVASSGPSSRYFVVTLGSPTGGLGLGPTTQAAVWIVN